MTPRMTSGVFNPAEEDNNGWCFMGPSLGVARYDSPAAPEFEILTDQQTGYFWRPEEVSLQEDQQRFKELPPHERRVFLTNLKYQIMMDSIQGRAPVAVFGPICSQPEMESWLATWSFFETIHSRSYTHIVRNLLENPADELDRITLDPEIMRRAAQVSRTYDDLLMAQNRWRHSESGDRIAELEREVRERLYLCLVAVNMLEGLQFYSSFACAFSFAERVRPCMEGNSNVIRLIARDENLHLQGTREMLRRCREGLEGERMAEVAADLRDRAAGVVDRALEDEKAWVDHVFRDGSMELINARNLRDYVAWVGQRRREELLLPGGDPDAPADNPLPWMEKWTSSDALAQAPQEVSKAVYMIDAVESSLDLDALRSEFGPGLERSRREGARGTPA